MNRRAFLKVAALALAAAYSGVAEYSRAAASADEYIGADEYPSATLRTGIGADDSRYEFKAIDAGVAESPSPYNDSDGEDKPNPTSGEWPALLIRALPQPVKDVLGQVQPMLISAEGILALQDGGGNTLGNVPLARTQWNKEKSTALDRLLTEWSWGIVLHWYGEPEYFDKTVTGYLRGFDGLREANGYETRTSAHFLVGDALPATVDEYIGAESKEDVIGILQTQAPDADGIPFVASHLRSLNYKQFRERQQYFINALDALEFADKGNHSILQDFYTGSKIDPGWRTIAIEITGFNFDNPETAPGAQQMANVLGVVWAVMKRYKISALDVLGHNELSLDKPDPGKLFMATIRYLLGVKALIDTDEEMKELVFGQFLNEGHIGEGASRLYRSAAYSGTRMLDAVGRYFKFVRDYLVLVSRPARVYAWEKRSQYWMLLDQLPLEDSPAARRKVASTSSFGFPLDGKISLKGDVFLKPESHAGVDLFPEREQASRKLSGISEVKLAADGVCLFAGKNAGGCAGKIVIFRHREQEGAEILTIYTHLSELNNLQMGAKYPKGHILGKIASPQVFMERFLHFAVAYGATWETDLSQRADLPMNAKPEWIKERFLDPTAYLSAKG
jgi:murein DD-endopeptidase MepM/ murein hydrolase activator NlpD